MSKPRLVRQIGQRALCAVAAALATAACVAHADLIITVDTTFDGGLGPPDATLTVSPPGAVLVSDARDEPALSLVRGAGSSGVEVLVIGALKDESGLLLVSSESRLATTGTGSRLVDSHLVPRSSSYVGLSAGSSGAAIVTGLGSSWTNDSEFYVGYLGTGMLLIEDAGYVFNGGDAGLGHSAGSLGNATVTGEGSTWAIGGSFALGGTPTAEGGHGTLEILSAAQVDVAGTTKLWTVSTLHLDGGTLTTASFDRTLGAFHHSDGTLRIDRGRYTQAEGILEISGNTAAKTATFELLHGADTAGVAALVVGSLPNRHGELLISGGSTMTNAGDGSSLGTLGTGNVGSGNAYLGLNAGSTGHATVTGAGSSWHNTGAIYVGRFGAGSLTVADGATLTTLGAGEFGNLASTLGYDAGSSGEMLVTGEGSTWDNHRTTWIGFVGEGQLTISDGGSVNSTTTILGYFADASGTVLVTGENSTWQVGTLTVGNTGDGELTIADGAHVTASSIEVGAAFLKTGTVTVAGPGSELTNSGALYLGRGGDVQLTITDGGRVSNTDAAVRSHAAGAAAVATVTGAGSTWTNDGSLYLAGTAVSAVGPATLTIGPGGTVFIDDTLKLWEHATVNIHGGTLRFDIYDREPAAVVNYLAGTIQLAGDRAVGLDTAIDAFFGPAPVLPTHKGLAVEGVATLILPVTLDGGTFSVGGLVNGQLLDFQGGTFELTDSDLTIGATGQFGGDLTLTSDKAVRVSHGTAIESGGRLTITGTGLFTTATLSNHGEIALAGDAARLVSSAATVTNHGVVFGTGRIEGGFVNAATGVVQLEAGHRLSFTGAFNNQPGGRITGRGTLLASGLENHGQILLAGGFSDLYTSLNAYAGSQVIVTGGATATFYEDVVHNGAEFRTGADSHAVFFGEVAGAGAFTGPGTVHFEGTLSPGNSTASLSFAGDVVLGETATLQLAVAGSVAGLEHDQLAVAGQITLAGTLDLSLVDDPLLPHWQPIALITAGTILGSFDQILLPAPAERLLVIQQLDQQLNLLAGLRGDMNLDGVVDAVDVAPFVLALTDPSAYEAEYGVEPASAGDINGDGAFDAVDVAPFVQLLVGGGSQSVPEPGSLALLGLSTMVLICRGKPRR
ncbi:MAG: PEP-CTERM sorting domain-containing protein [Phycisphaeraceae bacterium]